MVEVKAYSPWYVSSLLILGPTFPLHARYHQFMYKVVLACKLGRAGSKARFDVPYPSRHAHTVRNRSRPPPALASFASKTRRMTCCDVPSSTLPPLYQHDKSALRLHRLRFLYRVVSPGTSFSVVRASTNSCCKHAEDVGSFEIVAVGDIVNVLFQRVLSLTTSYPT